jgi:hypothetical protein
MTILLEFMKEELSDKLALMGLQPTQADENGLKGDSRSLRSAALRSG